MGSFCKSGSRSTTQTTDIPDYIKTPLKENLDKASQLVKQPYQQYGGQRIEGFSQDQLDAFQQIRNQAGQGQADLQTAMAGIKSLSPAQAQQVQASTFDSQTAQNYMNPYTERVLDVARQRAFDAEDIASQKRAANQLAAGAFGDNSRRFVENAEARSNMQDRLAAMEADQLAKAYGAAQQAYKTDATLDMQSQLANQKAGLQESQLNTQQALGAAQGIASLANQGQGLTFDQANALMQIGGQQQNLGQAGLDLAYSDFQQQQAYPYQQIGFMADLLQGAPMGTITTMTQPTPSPFQSAVGLGLTGLGIYGQGGGFGAGGFSMGNLFGQ